MSEEVLGPNVLQRWRTRPIYFIEQVLRDPETGQPFELYEAQKQFFEHCWDRDTNGRAVYPEQCVGAPKKTGKTTIGGIHLLTTTCLYGGRFAEAYCVANDFEQAQGRVFQQIKRIIECSPYLKDEVNITQSRITFPQTGAVIQAIASGDAAAAAGGHPVISSFDELRGYTSERSRRLWDEMIPVPTRMFSVRLTTTYAGFSGESVLLEELYNRGMAQPEIAPNLHAGDGLLMAWHHEPIAPWQTQEWLDEMRRTLRPNQYLRMIENRFVSSENTFVSMAAWDRIVNPSLGIMPPTKQAQVFIGIDASVKHDSTAIVVVARDGTGESRFYRLVNHYIFHPSPDAPLDFEATIERTVLDLCKKYYVVQVLFDPYQMASTSQRLVKAGVPIEEFPQSSPNLTAATQNLYELIQSQQLVVSDAEMRLAVSRAVALETSRGWKISKDKQTHKIDVVVALAMACHAAVTCTDARSYYNLDALAG